MIYQLFSDLANALCKIFASRSCKMQWVVCAVMVSHWALLLYKWGGHDKRANGR
jgi:hypothetical protein|tara:strand:- start:481 stop:642 length:162 start_codon:yes stop_codon:yes gene_type:complete